MRRGVSAHTFLSSFLEHGGESARGWTRNSEMKNRHHTDGDSAQFAQFCLLGRWVACSLGLGVRSELQGSRKCPCPEARTPVRRSTPAEAGDLRRSSSPPPSQGDPQETQSAHRPSRCEMCTCWQIDQRHDGGVGDGGGSR